ncbi:MAG: hypothetical protein Q9170_004772 [Blastenia crenularia]
MEVTSNSKSRPNGEVVIGDTESDGRVVLYIIKADETSYINYIKPLILAAELNLPHILSIIDTKDEWFYTIHPERMVPALKDKDPVTGEDVVVFEGTACLQYLADRFDGEGLWTGRTAYERGNVLAWTAYQTAGIGATAKYWLYFLRGYPTRANPERIPKTIEEYALLETQFAILSNPLCTPYPFQEKKNKNAQAQFRNPG